MECFVTFLLQTQSYEMNAPPYNAIYFCINIALTATHYKSNLLFRSKMIEFIFVGYRLLVELSQRSSLGGTIRTSSGSSEHEQGFQDISEF